MKLVCKFLVSRFVVVPLQCQSVYLAVRATDQMDLSSDTAEPLVIFFLYYLAVPILS